MTERAHLSHGGVDFIACVIDGALVIDYWGEPLSSSENFDAIRNRSVANSAFDSLQFSGVMREQSRGWLGAPTLSGHRNGNHATTRFNVTNFAANQNSLHVTHVDAIAELHVETSYEIDACGVLAVNAAIKNIGKTDYVIDNYTHWLPLADRATHTLDFAGRWSNERNPQRREIATGRWVRETREGRSGHNFTIIECALTEQTNFAHGEVWAIALAWSGNSHHSVERNWDRSQSLGAGELLNSGEVILKSGETYNAPTALAGYSNNGLDGLSHAFYQRLRARASHPKSPRPLTLNVWEAIAFNHSDEALQKIADVAAEIGVERLVLDDGWFHLRRDDRAGLGDWVVDPQVWPKGLAPIFQYIKAKGMQVGLWFEGEMINPDSDLYRAHPEWVLHTPQHPENLWRHELVLDLTNPEAFSHVLQQVSKILTDLPIDYIKWDHNRVVVDTGIQSKVRAQTLAIYRLFSELKKRHPDLEIESCASGGGRIDLGIIDYVDRFWVSDNNDALERQTMQRWTSLVIPPELLGSHVGPSPSHQTGRQLPLSFRAITALFGHAGIEWDISKISTEEKTQLTSWISYYKKARTLIHSGRTVRADYADSSGYLHGVVAQNKTEALFAYVQLRPTQSVHPAQLIFAGLDPARTYDVSAIYPAGKPTMMLITPPSWLTGVKLTGDQLMKAGLPAPILAPENALLIELK